MSRAPPEPPAPIEDGRPFSFQFVNPTKPQIRRYRKPNRCAPRRRALAAAGAARTALGTIRLGLRKTLLPLRDFIQSFKRRHGGDAQFFKFSDERVNTRIATRVD